MTSFDEYQSPVRSKLEDQLELIRGMRMHNWPLQAIIRRLSQEHGIKVAESTLSEFCARRNIVKGGNRPAAAPLFPAPQASLPRAAAGPDGLTVRERIEAERRARAEREDRYRIDTGYVPGKPLTLLPPESLSPPKPPP